jgi:hypothetical protein
MGRFFENKLLDAFIAVLDELQLNEASTIARTGCLRKVMQ